MQVQESVVARGEAEPGIVVLEVLGCGLIVPDKLVEQLLRRGKSTT